MNVDGERFETLRPRLKRMAYRMLGSWAEAEDAVQDTYLRLACASEARSLEALARTCLARLCLDRLKSARTRRESYYGEWLPEPVLDRELFPEPDPLSKLEEKDTLAYGLLVLLEKLTPDERIVFVMREALHSSYAEVAAVVGKAEAGCRQLMVRARRALQGAEPTGQLARPVLERFLRALQGGDATALRGLFADTAVSVSDGGGKAVAALKPILGADKVVSLLLGLAAKAPAGLSWELAECNGQAGLLIYQGGQLISVFVPEVTEGRIEQLYIMRNPDKMAGLNR